MKTIAISYGISAIAFLALDAAWLWTMGGVLYRSQLGSLMLERFLIVPAIAFYLIYPIGIAVFSVAPALQAASAIAALGHGLLFGALAYCTYNLTNMATLRGWSPVVTAVDIAWGTFATGAAAVAAYWIMRALSRV